MAFGPGGQGNLKAEINVTPLVDVVLVLLIIFMVVTPMLSRGRAVDLPVASSTESEGEHELQDPIVLTLTADKQIWIETQRIPLTKLRAEVEERLRVSPGREVLIKADAIVSVRDLRPVLHALKGGSISQIAFAVLAGKGGGK